MNIVKILGDIVPKLDCGLCWRFAAGGRQDYLNLIQNDPNSDCCAVLGILRTQVSTVYEGNVNFREKRYRDWNLELFAGVPSRLDIQFYNELRPEDSKNSKWEKYLHPIFCCLSDVDDRICEVHSCQGNETTIDVVRWDLEQKINYLDNNYDGWFVRATFREWIA